MAWRPRRGNDAKVPEGVLAGATLARVVGTDQAVAAVRRAVARAELDQPIPRLGIAAIGELGPAQAVAAVLAVERDVVAGTLASLAGGGVDAFVAVSPGSLPTPAVVEQVRDLGPELVGVVIVSDQVDERAAQAEARVAELQAEVERLTARIRELEALPPLPTQAPARKPRLADIQWLVDEAFAQGAPVAEEWAAYLPLLREQVLPDGTFADQLLPLIESVFGESLGAVPQTD
jgi:hypothetical protein